MTDDDTQGREPAVMKGRSAEALRVIDAVIRRLEVELAAKGLGFARCVDGVECSYRATPAEIADFVRSAFDAVIAEVEQLPVNHWSAKHVYRNKAIEEVLEILKRHRGES